MTSSKVISTLYKYCDRWSHDENVICMLIVVLTILYRAKSILYFSFYYKNLQCKDRATQRRTGKELAFKL